jgi:hypothetical protein
MSVTLPYYIITDAFHGYAYVELRFWKLGFIFGNFVISVTCNYKFPFFAISIMEDLVE